MNIDEITLPNTMDDATRTLRRGGYDDITKKPGHTGGAYAEVYAKPELPYVVKLFLPTDEPYLRYLNLIMRMKNPHFPVVRGKPIKINNQYWGVRLEKLAPITDRAMEDRRYWMEVLLQYLQVNNIESAKFAASNLSPTEKQAIVSIFTNCVRNKPTFIDMHKHNVMARGDVLVIIDPIALIDD